MSKITITATKIVNPAGKTVSNTSSVVFVESDKITVLPVAGATESVILANGYQFYVLAEPTEIGAALGSENMAAYT